ncbi:MAG TPA: cytochrome b562 [Planctomycetota bacterium]|nr:cytochrome b562 [Planctomycetota bacterium]
MTFRKSLRPLVLSALLVGGAVAVASTNPSLGRSAPESAGEGEGDDLEEVMQGIDKNFEAATKAIENKDGPAALELMTKLEQGCIGAKILTPPKLRTIEEKDKAAFIAGYRKQVLVMLKSMVDLEIALVDNDFEKAKKVADEIDSQKKMGHDTYKKMPRKKKE